MRLQLIALVGVLSALSSVEAAWQWNTAGRTGTTCTQFDITVHDPDEVVEPSQLWDTQTVALPSAGGPSYTSGCAVSGGCDFAGFLSNPSELWLTMAVPLLYEGDYTTITFEGAANTNNDMLAPIDDTVALESNSDEWTCETSHEWNGGGSFAAVDAANDGTAPDNTGWSFDDDNNCFSVYRMSTVWATFRANLGSGLTRTEYDQYDPDAASIAAARNATGAGNAGKYIEFCGEFKVEMSERFDNVGLPGATISVIRNVIDRFVFCLVFQTQVTVQQNITIYDAPGYFQLLQLQAVANLNPTNDNCTADVDLNVVTLTQWPYMLTAFTITGHDGSANGNADATNKYYAVTAATAPKCTAATTYTGYTGNSTLADCVAATGQQYGTCTNSGASSGGACQQNWEIDFCNSGCEADGILNITFKATCRPAVASADCPLGAPPIEQNVGGTITLDTASYCAVLIESVDVTGELFSYEDATLATARNDFLTGQTAYYKASFWANDGSGGVDATAPEICGISPMRVDIESFIAVGPSPASIIPVTTLWAGLQKDDPAVSYQDITGLGVTPGASPTVSGTSLSFNMYGDKVDDGCLATGTAGDCGVESTAIDCAGDCSCAGSACPGDDDKYNLVGFSYVLDGTMLAPPQHGTFVLRTTLVVEVYFCGTSKKKLLELTYEYKEYAVRTPGQLLQLQDGPQNLMEVGNELGMFDPFPDQDQPVESEAAPAESDDVIIGKPEENVAGGGNTGGTEIWPIVAGVVGGVTVCIVLILIALRRRQSKTKTKTVAVVPDSKDYGPVAVAVTEVESSGESA